MFEVPIHHFIVVDRFSNDGTVETVREVFPNAKIVESNARLAVCRKLEIDLVDTEFFVFVDSDVELGNSWFKRIMNHVDSRTGAVQGRVTFLLKHLMEWYNWEIARAARFKEAFREKVIVAIAENPDIIRGTTYDTLIRTCLVKDWNPPRIVSAFEDHLLLRHVVRKGYAWKDVIGPLAKHHVLISLWAFYLKRVRWNIAGARLVKYENMSTWSFIRDVLQQTICAFLASLQTRQPLILLHVIVCQLVEIQGWTGWSKYLDLRR